MDALSITKSDSTTPEPPLAEDKLQAIATSVNRHLGRSVEEIIKAGLELANLTAERAESLGLDLKNGALIVKVEPEGPAAEAGLSRGLTIVNIDKKSITTAEQAKAALEGSDRSKGALVQAVSPQGGREYVIVKVQK